jgi:hypothetical protein
MWRDDQKAGRSILWVILDLGIDSQQRYELSCGMKLAKTKDRRRYFDPSSVRLETGCPHVGEAEAGGDNEIGKMA